MVVGIKLRSHLHLWKTEVATNPLWLLERQHWCNFMYHTFCCSSSGNLADNKLNISSNRNCYSKRYISYLYYLLDNNRSSYIKTIQKNTLYNLHCLISDKKLLEECTNNQIDFRMEKLEAPDEF